MDAAEPGPTDGHRIARAMFAAFAASDRAALEALIAPEFRFTRPPGHSIDRATYFADIWPNHAQIAEIRIVHIGQDGAHVLAVFEVTLTDGDRFRNAEMVTIRNGQVAAAEVYPGWDLPSAGEA